MTLWHYTCSHSRREIGRQGQLLAPSALRPHHSAGLPPLLRWLSDVVWATDLDRPDVAALGLTSDTLGCDRTEHRYRITTPELLLPWREWVELHHPPAAGVRDLEFARGVQPEHWWIGAGPVSVRLEPLARAS